MRRGVSSEKAAWARCDYALSPPPLSVISLPHGPGRSATTRSDLRPCSPPTFALEIVGTDPEKDLNEAPLKYAALGVRELIVFDPFPAAAACDGNTFARCEAAFEAVASPAGTSSSGEINASPVSAPLGSSPSQTVFRDPPPLPIANLSYFFAILWCRRPP
jgi:hypothetical protein